MEKRTPLTDMSIRALQQNGSWQEVTDTGFRNRGTLSLRVTPAGRKIFRYTYRSIAGKQRRVVIGEYPGFGLAQARERALELSAEVLKGNDPVAELEKKREAARQVVTFGSLAEKYLSDPSPFDKVKAPNTVKEERRIAKKDLLPAWENRPIDSITKRDVLRVLESIKKDRGSPIAANRTRSLIGSIFNYAIDTRGVLPEHYPNPGQLAKRPVRKEDPRSRTLTESELAVVWNTLDNFEEPLATLYRFLILFGQRTGEVTQMRWDQIDANGIWWIPREITKNRQGHSLPLPELALSYLERLREAAEMDNPWLFPSPYQHTGHVLSLKKAKKRLIDRCNEEASQVRPFTNHDLRRTFKTTLRKRLRIDAELVDRIQNHLSAIPKVRRIYDTHTYHDEMRQALERWAAELQRISTGKSVQVVQLRRG